MIHFEQFEIDDLRAAMEQMEYEEVASSMWPSTNVHFCEFLNRVVETADAHRARKVRTGLNLALDRKSVQQ